MGEGDFDRVVGQIYDAARDPGLLRGVLEEVARLAGADAWHLLGWDFENGADVLGILCDDVRAPRALTDYNAYYGAIDPRRALAAQVGTGTIISCQHFFDDRFVSRNEFYQDYLRPLGLRYSLGGSVRRSETVDYQLGLTRGIGGGAFSPETEIFLSRLTPHLDRVLRLSERYAALAQAGEAAGSGLDAMPLAVIALDRAGRVLKCNAFGERLLEAGDTLRLRKGTMECAAGRQSCFVAAFNACLKTSRPTSLLLRQGGSVCYSMTLTAPPWQGALAGNGCGTAVLCLVAPLGQRRVATVRQLMTLFGLSPAEARLARALAAGESPDAYALAEGLRPSTVKSQLRAIFSKMGVDRQAALVRMVLAVPAVREYENA